VRVFDAEVTRERDPVIVRLVGATIILNAGGGPTPDKPGVHLAPPDDPARTSAFLNLRVDDIVDVHRRWSERGARFLTEPIDRGPEIRAFLRDPDGHLIEVGQAKERP
jgi:catechol 2,3-dioxygenase-like lactoylglutathione lyase family enzyme